MGERVIPLTDGQIEMRNELTAIAFKYLESEKINIVQAYIACIGAAAICAAILPDKSRERLIEATEGTLLAHANKRAQEIRSGAFDSELMGN